MSHPSKRIVVACVATCLTGLASAQGYVGLGIGESRAKLDCTGADLCDKTDTAYRLYGGYEFGPNLAVEAVYYDQGKARVSGLDPALGRVDGDFKGQGVGLWGLVGVPVQAAAFYAKLGLVSASIKLNATSSVLGSASSSERHTRGAWGLGASYEFAPRWVGRLDFERMRVRFMDEKVAVELLTLGAHYRF